MTILDKFKEKFTPTLPTFSEKTYYWNEDADQYFYLIKIEADNDDLVISPEWTENPVWVGRKMYRRKLKNGVIEQVEKSEIPPLQRARFEIREEKRE